MRWRSSRVGFFIFRENRGRTGTTQATPLAAPFEKEIRPAAQVPETLRKSPCDVTSTLVRGHSRCVATVAQNPQDSAPADEPPGGKRAGHWPLRDVALRLRRSHRPAGSIRSRQRAHPRLGGDMPDLCPRLLCHSARPFAWPTDRGRGALRVAGGDAAERQRIRQPLRGGRDRAECSGIKREHDVTPPEAARQSGRREQRPASLRVAVARVASGRKTLTLPAP